MRIEFYNVNDDNRVVSKNLGSVIHAIDNAQIYNATSIMSPDFLVDYAPYVVNSNYVHVPLWNRYYYITDVTASPGGRAVMHCREDVLMSNASAILDLDCYISRYEDQRTPLVNDSRMTKSAKTMVYNSYFSENPFAYGDGSLFQNYHYILAVVGGDGSQSGGDYT